MMLKVNPAMFIKTCIKKPN